MPAGIIGPGTDSSPATTYTAGGASALAQTTATVTELNRLHGIGLDVTAANLTELCDGSETELHSHAGGGGAGGMTRIYQHTTDGIETTWAVPFPDTGDHARILVRSAQNTGTAVTILVPDDVEQGGGIDVPASANGGALVTIDLPFFREDIVFGIFRAYPSDTVDDGTRIRTFGLLPLPSLGLLSVDADTGETPTPLPDGSIIEVWAW